jgi:hypothetical protein
VAGVKIASEHWSGDRRTPTNIVADNEYSKQSEAERELSRWWARITTRDPDGKVVLFPRFLARLYWPPGEERPKDRLSLEDVKKLSAHLKSTVENLKPDTVEFDAVICTPDPESRRRIGEHNRRVKPGPTVMPPRVTFNRQRVPITVGALMGRAPRTATALQEAALRCIVNACQRLPAGDQPRMVGHGIRESESYDPTIPYEIGFSILPAAPDDPTLQPRLPRAP